MADDKKESRERKSRSDRNKQSLVLYAMLLVITSIIVVVVAAITFAREKPHLGNLSMVYLDYTVAAIVLLVCGVIGIFLGLFYCCLLQKDDGKVTALWATLLILFIVEFIVACACWWYTQYASRYLEDYLTTPSNEGVPLYMDIIQSQEKCCGYKGKSDYKTIPDSCCPGLYCGRSQGTTPAPFADGCGKVLKDRIYMFSLVTGIVAIVAGFVSACGFCGAFLMERPIEVSEPSQRDSRQRINMNI